MMRGAPHRAEAHDDRRYHGYVHGWTVEPGEMRYSDNDDLWTGATGEQCT